MNNDLNQKSSKDLLKILSRYQHDYPNRLVSIKEELTKRGVSQNDIEFASENYVDRSTKSDVTTGQRFVNFIIDIFIIRYILDYYLLFPVIRSQFSNQSNDNIYLIMFSFLSFLLYYILFEGILQVTVGKLVTGTKVVTIDGGKPSLNIIFIRTFCRCIPLDPLSFFGSPGWHDTFSKTKLIKK